MTRTLPQAECWLDFMLWMRDHLHYDHGYKIKPAFYAALHGGRDFLRENDITQYPDPRFDWSRPSANEVAYEYILRDG